MLLEGKLSNLEIFLADEQFAGLGRGTLNSILDESPG